MFLFDSSSNCLDLSDQTHDEIATTIADTYSSVENTNQESWPSERKRISGALTSAIEILKKKYPKFHSLNSDDPDLVKVISRVLRHGEIGIELGRQFSTRVEPKPLGRFVIEGDNKTFQFDHEADSTLRSVTKWLLTESTRESLKQIRPDFDIEKADWIQVYEGEPLHRESERSSITAALGVVAYRSFVIEIGELGKPPLRLVIEEDQFGQEHWTKRETAQARKILRHKAPQDVSSWVLAFRQSRYAISEKILKHVSEKNNITLAPDFTYNEIPSVDDAARKISIRWREFRPEIRTDKLVDEDLSDSSILKAVHGLAEWHAFLFISGGFINSRNRDIVVDSTNGKLTALGVGGSFVSLRGLKSSDLVIEIAPKLFGNSLAQLIGPFTYLSDAPKEKVEQLLIVYRTGLSQALKAAKRVTLPPNLKEEFDQIVSNSPKGLSRPLKPSLDWFDEVVGHLKNEKFIKYFRKLVVGSLREELAHIKKIISQDGLFIQDEAKFCAEAVQAFIEQHLREPKKYRDALNIIDKLPEMLHGVNSYSRGAYVALVDLKTRSEELAKSSKTEQVATYFRVKVASVENAYQYADAIRNDQQNWPLNTPDLSPEELRRVYLSFKQLEGVFSESSGNKQLNKAKRILGFWSPKP
jgi:hypothetical protein